MGRYLNLEGKEMRLTLNAMGNQLLHLKVGEQEIDDEIAARFPQFLQFIEETKIEDDLKINTITTETVTISDQNVTISDQNVTISDQNVTISDQNVTISDPEDIKIVNPENVLTNTSSTPIITNQVNVIKETSEDIIKNMNVISDKNDLVKYAQKYDILLKKNRSLNNMKLNFVDIMNQRELNKE